MSFLSPPSNHKPSGRLSSLTCCLCFPKPLLKPAHSDAHSRPSACLLQSHLSYLPWAFWQSPFPVFLKHCFVFVCLFTTGLLKYHNYRISSIVQGHSAKGGFAGVTSSASPLSTWGLRGSVLALLTQWHGLNAIVCIDLNQSILCMDSHVRLWLFIF